MAEKGIVLVAESLAIAAAPWLNTPGIKQIWQAAFEWIADKFTKAAELGATFTIIDLQIGAEQTALTRALAALVAAQKSGDKDAIRKAIQDYADAHSALIHFDGSAPPK